MEPAYGLASHDFGQDQTQPSSRDRGFRGFPFAVTQKRVLDEDVRIDDGKNQSLLTCDVRVADLLNAS
jgi:hypothetical protein